MTLFSPWIVYLVEAFPLVVALILMVKAGRALATGTVTVSSRYRRPHAVTRNEQPVQFWTELGMYGVVLVFMVMLGLLFSGHAPHWFLAMFQSGSKRTHIR